VTNRRGERSKWSYPNLKKEDRYLHLCRELVHMRHLAVPKRFIHAFQLHFGTNDSDSASSMISSDG